MITEKTPGVLFLENLCDENETWRNLLGYFAIRWAIDDVLYDDALEIKEALCDVDHPEVTIDDLFTFAEPTCKDVENHWIDCEKDPDGYSELDIMICSDAIEGYCELDNLLQLLNKKYPKLHSLVVANYLISGADISDLHSLANSLE